MTIILLVVASGVFLSGLVAYQHNLTVGILTFEDYILYSYSFNKTHTKGVAVGLGLFLGFTYLRILEYRKASYEEKKTFFRVMHFMYNSSFVTILLYMYALGMLVFITGVPRSANANAYSWTKNQNVAYNAFGRLGFLSSLTCWILIIFMEKGNFLKAIFCSKIFIALGKLTIAAYLIYPIVVGGRFYATQQAFFVSYPNMAYSMISNIIICYLLALPLYLFVQAPAEGLLRTTLKLMFQKKSHKESVREPEQKGKFLTQINLI